MYPMCIHDRDGTPEAVIFHYPGCLLGHVTKKMKGYCKLTEDKCRRVELLGHFPSSATECIDIVPKHLCCDHCTVMCDCGDEHKLPLYSPSDRKHSQEDYSLNEVETGCVSCDQRAQLKERLLAFRQVKLSTKLNRELTHKYLLYIKQSRVFYNIY